jgi:pimeloyl-ACP methyl ester carboxylesterase
MLATGILVAGCALRSVRQQSHQIEALVEIQGQVKLAPGQRGQAYALLFSDDGQYLTRLSRYALTANGRYVFFVPPGAYVIGAYVDVNGDGEYQPIEPATYYGIEEGRPMSTVVTPQGRVVMEPLSIQGPIESRPDVETAVALRRGIVNTGHVVSLNDPIFSRDSASMGYWRPVDYLRKLGGGLLFLQEYQEGKTPIVFVHGANGTALDFEAVIASLDRNEYQPWVLQYPSGVRLDMVSEYLLQTINELHAKHGFGEMCLVAHSMGGLVARSFVMKHNLSGSPVRIALVMTINSPMNGMKSAKSGARHSPVVVPSWRDVAEGSEFIQNLHAWRWPKEVPYCLVFSYKPGEGGDGVAPLETQVPLSLQDEASWIYGFPAEHSAVLTDEAFITRFKRILAGRHGG